MNIRKIVPQYFIREDIGNCYCHIDDICDCMPDLILSKNGLTGYGLGRWTYTDETCPPSIDEAGKAYWCEFLGLPGFWAMGETDAAETLLKRLDTMGLCATVNFQNTKQAQDVINELEKNK
ncbi:hypothetical protein [Salmonella phage SSBI34]|nr:hypothetical protein [Salmonella phage SSBI34]